MRTILHRYHLVHRGKPLALPGWLNDKESSGIDRVWLFIIRTLIGHRGVRRWKMPHEILIKAGEVAVEGQLNDSETAEAIADILPVRAKAQRWGGEIYFDIDLACQLEEDAREVMGEGELGYWPTGTALCIFFGPTPASRGEHEIRAASPVNVVGTIRGDWSRLWDVSDGADIHIEKRKTP